MKKPSSSTRRGSTSGASGWSRWLVPGVIAVVAAVVIGVVLATVTSGNDSTPTSSKIEVAKVVTVSGTALPPYQPGSADPAVGKASPVVTGVTFDGAAVTVPGKGPSVVAVVAHWCPHCQREVPVIMNLRRNGSWPKEVGLAAVSTGVNPERGNYPPSAWLTSAGWDAPVLVDDEQQSADKAFGETGFPFLVWLDANNKVVLRTAGEIPEATLSRMLGQLAAGKTPENPLT